MHKKDGIQEVPAPHHLVVERNVIDQRKNIVLRSTKRDIILIKTPENLSLAPRMP
jgi:hypothetical protein